METSKSRNEHAGICRDRLSCRVGEPAGGERGNHGPDLLGLSDARKKRQPLFRTHSIGVDHRSGHFGGDQAGLDVVNSDVFTPEADRERLGHHRRRRLEAQYSER